MTLFLLRARIAELKDELIQLKIELKLKEKKARKDGYYWIKFQGTWIVGNWTQAHDFFIVCFDSDEAVSEEECDEIEEKQLIHK